MLQTPRWYSKTFYVEWLRSEVHPGAQSELSVYLNSSNFFFKFELSLTFLYTILTEKVSLSQTYLKTLYTFLNPWNEVNDLVLNELRIQL